MKKIVKVKNLLIGSNHIYIQSMTNTKTKNIEETVKQILSLEEYGCELVRVAVKDESDALAIKEIIKQIHIPLVADIHFDYRLALLSIESGANKIRINPGNMPKEHLKEIVSKCHEYHVPIRIGVNSGSLSEDILDKYGPTSEGLIEEAKREIKLLNDLGMDDIIVSLKATDINTFIDANIKAAKLFPYPLHIGLTEAGPMLKGSIRSTYAVSKLLDLGIGDTLRVSLTSDPINEIIAAKEILKIYNKYNGVEFITCPTCGRCEYNMTEIIEKIEPIIDKINKKLKIAVMGCVVNGIGEGKEADLGIAGGKDKAVIFAKGKMIKTVEYQDIIDEFNKQLMEMTKDVR